MNKVDNICRKKDNLCTVHYSLQIEFSRNSIRHLIIRSDNAPLIIYHVKAETHFINLIKLTSTCLRIFFSFHTHEKPNEDIILPRIRRTIDYFQPILTGSPDIIFSRNHIQPARLVFQNTPYVVNILPFRLIRVDLKANRENLFFNQNKSLILSGHAMESLSVLNQQTSFLSKLIQRRILQQLLVNIWLKNPIESYSPIDSACFPDGREKGQGQQALNGHDVTATCNESKLSVPTILARPAIDVV